MRKEEIDEYLIYIQDTIPEIEEARTQAGNQKDYKSLVKPKVTSTLEHLRRVLDYATKDIFDYVYDPDGTMDLQEKENKYKKIFFPYGNDINQFKSLINRSLPNLQIRNTDIYILLESYQAYKTGDKTIYDLCCITNRQKHDNSRQTRTDSYITSIRGNQEIRKDLDIRGFGFVMDYYDVNDSEGILVDHIHVRKEIRLKNVKDFRLQNCLIGNTFIADEYFIANSDDYVNEKYGQISIQRINYADFIFEGTKIKVMELIQNGYRITKNLIADLYKIIPVSS